MMRVSFSRVFDGGDANTVADFTEPSARHSKRGKYSASALRVANRAETSLDTSSVASATIAA
jgi:hypothetical protein